MLVGSRADAINARALVQGRWARLTPRPLVDDRYVLPESTLTNPDYAAAAGTLAGWAVESPELGTHLPEQVPLAPFFAARIGGRSYYHTRSNGLLTEPAANVFRFEVKANDAEGLSDSQGGSRRSELVCTAAGRGVGAATVWIAFTFILGPHDGMVPVVAGNWGIVHQWHSIDKSIGRSPVLVVNCSDNQLSILTRSSTSLYNGNGIPVTHYTAALPAQGALNHVVMQSTFGQAGHLNAWIGGVQVVNVDTPIGYYTDLTDGSGRTELGYPHWGLYQKNHSETDVVYIANPEWSAGSLAARIAAPTAVPDLSPWA